MSRANDHQDGSKSPDIFELVHGFVTASMEGELTDAEIADFEQVLRDQPEARRLYADYLETTVDLSRMIADREGSKSPLALPLASATSPAVPFQAVSSPAALPSQTPPKSPVLGFLGGAIEYINHSPMLMFWLVALVVGGWFAFQLGSLMMGRARPGGAPVAARPADANSPDASHPPGGSFADTALPRQRDSVAWMTANVDCHWRAIPPAVPAASAPAPGDAGSRVDPDKLFHVGSELSAGQQLDLIRGLAEITFRSGARIVLNGPAHFTVGSASGGKLQIGKLTARVPHEAHGFTIDSPAGKVVDLGTEFGVAVAADKTMDVEVFVGEVTVDSSSPGSQTPNSPSTTPRSPTKVSAGHAARVAPGQPVAAIPLDPKRFVRGLGPREDSHVAEAGYLDWMRSLKPVVWLRMEGEAGDRVLRDDAGGPDAKLCWDGPGDPFVDGRLGKALWLRGSKLHDFAIMPGYPPAEHGKLSVAAWVYADRFPLGHSAAVCNFAESDSVGQFGQFYLGLGQDPGKPWGLFACVTMPGGRFVTLNEPATNSFPLYEWQHIAFTTDGETLRLYRQGREVASMKHAGLLYPVRQRVLGIGVRPNDSGTAPGPAHPDYWEGKLDEIAIFHDVLAASDIQKMATAPP